MNMSSRKHKCLQDISTRHLRPLSSNIKKLRIVSAEPFMDSWTLHGVRIFGVYDSYEVAVPKLKLAEIQSDLNTDDDDYKKSRASRKRVISSSDEEDTSEEETIGVREFPKFPKGNEVSNPSSTPRSNMRPTVLFTPKSMRPAVSTPISMRPAVATPNSERPEVVSPNSMQPAVSTPNQTSLTPTVMQPIEDCGRCGCHLDKDFKNKIENDLDQIKRELKLVLQMLREQRGPAIDNENNDDHNDFDERISPMRTEEDIQIMEKRLRNEEEKKKMISFLAHIGGHEINTIVKNILRKQLSDAISSTYNWEGKKGKNVLISNTVGMCQKSRYTKPQCQGNNN